MNFKIVSEASLWLIPLCLLGGVVLAFILYYRDKRSDFPERLRWLLAGLRFLTASLLLFLLLSPMVQTLARTKEKPSVIIGLDNSQSMLTNRGEDHRRELEKRIEELAASVGNDYQVVTYTFGDQTRKGLRYDFEEKETDMAEFFHQVQSRFYNRNVGAMILISDGIYNTGNDPVYEAEKAGFPVYAVRAGDTSLYRDIAITRVVANKTAFKGNTFPVEVVVQANDLSGTSTTLKALHQGRELMNRNLNISGSRQSFVIPFSVHAAQTGQMRITIQAGIAEGERNLVNNVREIFVDVIDSKLKIAVVANSPHPDVAAIQKAFSTNVAVETDVTYDETLKQPADEYDVVIFHQIPSVTRPATELLSRVKKGGAAQLYILGTQSDLSAINGISRSFQLGGTNGTFNNAQAALNDGFSLFLVPDAYRSFFAGLPPLNTPFGNYQTGNQTQVLAYQQIGAITTRFPLISFIDDNQVRTGFIAGEGLWRWRISGYEKFGAHTLFDELMGKVIQYLGVKAERGLFRVNAKSYYTENERILMSASVLNNSYEAITSPQVSVVFTGPDGLKRESEFSVQGSSYYLDAGTFRPGNHAYTATAATPGGNLTQTGSFTVTELKLEEINTFADHGMLNRMAEKTGGEAFALEDMARIREALKQRGDIKTITYSRQQLTDLIDYVPLLILLILLLTAEWFIRKYNGSY